jgi:hypothetical protein
VHVSQHNIQQRLLNWWLHKSFPHNFFSNCAYHYKHKIINSNSKKTNWR